MAKVHGFLLAASVVVLSAVPALAESPVLLALNVPIQAPVTEVVSALKAPATTQAKTQEISSTDFDAFSSVNDPLYREGSKELLKQAIKDDGAAKPAPKAALRDAPVSKDAKPVKKLKKPRARKPVRSDPVKHSVI